MAVVAGAPGFEERPASPGSGLIASSRRSSQWRRRPGRTWRAWGCAWRCGASPRDGNIQTGNGTLDRLAPAGGPGPKGCRRLRAGWSGITGRAPRADCRTHRCRERYRQGRRRATAPISIRSHRHLAAMPRARRSHAAAGPCSPTAVWLWCGSFVVRRRANGGRPDGRPPFPPAAKPQPSDAPWRGAQHRPWASRAGLRPRGSASLGEQISRRMVVARQEHAMSFHEPSELERVHCQPARRG